MRRPYREILIVLTFLLPLYLQKCYIPAHASRMTTITANTLTSLPLLAPVKPKGRVKSKGQVQCLPFSGGRGQIVLAQLGPAGLCGRLLPIIKRRPITHSSRMQSASFICAAAAAAAKARRKAHNLLMAVVDLHLVMMVVVAVEVAVEIIFQAGFSYLAFSLF